MLIERLSRDTIFLGELAIALEVQLRDVQLRLALRQLGTRLFQRSPDRAVIQRCQQVPDLDLLTFLDQHARQHSIHLGADHDALQRQHRSDPCDETRHVLKADRDHFDGHGGSGMFGDCGRACQFPAGNRHTGDHQDDGGDGQGLSAHMKKTPNVSTGEMFFTASL